MLERKRGIRLDKANRNLQSTTQDNVISALKPLTWRYRKYFLLQRLSRLNCRLYTDTLFAKVKSIVGNTCAQFFIDGDFFQIAPMKSKLEAGTTLDRIKRDDGVIDGNYPFSVTTESG